MEIVYNNLAVIKPELDIITKVIVDTVPIEEIYLFGSWAYGIPNSDSDLDLYLIFRDDMKIREIEALDAVRIAISPVKKIPIDLLGLKINRFLYRKQFATLERKIFREGVKLYG